MLLFGYGYACALLPIHVFSLGENICILAKWYRIVGVFLGKKRNTLLLVIRENLPPLNKPTIWDLQKPGYQKASLIYNLHTAMLRFVTYGLGTSFFNFCQLN